MAAEKQAKFRGHWSSLTYGSGIHGEAKIKFVSPTVINMTLIYASNSVFKPNQHIKFQLELVRNERECYGYMIVAHPRQQIMVRINLIDTVFSGHYLSVSPYDYGTIHMKDNAVCKYIIEHVPDTQTTYGKNFDAYLARRESSLCVLI